MKTELDYAFLAEYAKTERGTITAIGASFTEAKSSSFPSVLDVSVAGRIRRPETEPVPEIRIVLTGPGLAESPQIDFDFGLEDEANAVHYDGKVASVFVFRAPVLIEQPGLYTFNIDLNGEHVRRLSFEVVSRDGE
ncbi:MAG: hypothetical protein HLX46_05935 [Corynebacterium sp.]|uniref:DUF6941 family protein n=1 Tax=Corynebacterium sp. TaxID=1720 RepID=UPI0017B48DEB|nr:hypothetical protein [Corynebacterium sp.]NWO16369.1 hypothetical protein [Corynebacterium sp.]